MNALNPRQLELALLLVHAGATLAMVGLIWFVQRVHYPLFAAVGSRGYAAYQAAHVSRTGPVVGVPMGAEALSALALLWVSPAGVDPALLWGGALLLALIWGSTALLQVPRHRELMDGFESQAHRRLVATNWIRSAAWSARGAIALVMLFQFASVGA